MRCWISMLGARFCRLCYLPSSSQYCQLLLLVFGTKIGVYALLDPSPNTLALTNTRLPAPCLAAAAWRLSRQAWVVTSPRLWPMPCPRPWPTLWLCRDVRHGSTAGQANTLGLLFGACWVLDRFRTLAGLTRWPKAGGRRDAPDEDYDSRVYR